MLGLNDTSTLVDHFVLSPREREKRDRRDRRGDEREGQGRKRNRNESEETVEIKTFPSTFTCYKDSRPCPTVSQYHLDPSDIRYATHSPHPTTPLAMTILTFLSQPQIIVPCKQKINIQCNINYKSRASDLGLVQV